MKIKNYARLPGLVLAVGTTLAIRAQNAGTPPPMPPSHPPMAGGSHPALTQQQMACLQKSLGTPSATNRPSPQKMAAAMKTCNIQMPSKPAPK